MPSFHMLTMFWWVSQSQYYKKNYSVDHTVFVSNLFTIFVVVVVVVFFFKGIVYFDSVVTRRVKCGDLT